MEATKIGGFAVKKLYSFFLCILPLALACISYVPKKPLSLQEQLLTYDMDHIKKLLGYDPQITLYLSKDLPANLATPTIYVHGWGESQHSIEFLKANTLLLPGTIIGFNFKDAHFSSAKMPELTLTNFCQTDDIASLVVTLKVLDECGIPAFHLFGTSRGAGTIITALNRLAHYDRHKKFFNTLEITHEQ